MTTEEFSSKTGATTRQLQHWGDIGLFSADQSDGRSRCYATTQIPLARLMVHIRSRKGSRFSVADLHRVASRALRSRFAVFHLDGTLSAFRTYEAVWSHLQEMEQPGWLIDVEKTAKPLI